MATFYKDFVGQPPYYAGAVDILTSDCIHAVDMLRWMGGEPAELASIVQQRESTYHNIFTALMRFQNGGTGVLLGNWTVGGRTHQFEMHGRRISVFANPDREASILEDNGTRTEVIDTKAAAGSEEFRVYYGFEAENRHFVDCVRAGRAPETSLEDAARTMELVERIYRSTL